MGQVHSLKLHTVATTEICRDSACNAVCPPYIKNKQKKLGLKIYLAFYIACTSRNIMYAGHVPWLLRETSQASETARPPHLVHVYGISSSSEQTPDHRTTEFLGL